MCPAGACLPADGRDNIDGVRSLGVALRRLTAAANMKQVDPEMQMGRVRNVEADGMYGCAFDVPSQLAQTLLASCVTEAAALGMLLDQPRSVGECCCGAGGWKLDARFLFWTGHRLKAYTYIYGSAGQPLFGAQSVVARAA